MARKKEITITKDLLGKNPTDATVARMVELLQEETGYIVLVGDTLKGNVFEPSNEVSAFDLKWISCLKKLVAEGLTTFEEIFEDIYSKDNTKEQV